MVLKKQMMFDLPNENKIYLQAKFLVFYLVFGVLVLLNFSLQAFDFFTFKNNPCGYYFFDQTCMHFQSFLLNKTIRFFVNFLLLYLVYFKFSQRKKIVVLSLVFLLIGIALLDVFVFQGPGFISKRVHSFIHPVAFSPLLPLVFVLASIVIGKQNSKIS